MIQWLRVRLAMQGTPGRSHTPRRRSTPGTTACPRAANTEPRAPWRPRALSPRPGTCAPGRLAPQQGKPPQWKAQAGNSGVTPLTATTVCPQQQRPTQHSQKQINKHMFQKTPKRNHIWNRVSTIRASLKIYSLIHIRNSMNHLNFANF